MKIIETFGRNKMKYLVPIKMKNCLVCTEEGHIYGVSKILTDNHNTNSKNDIAYVLTDKDFIIRSFTPNSSKLLNLHLSLSNLNLDITNYISEMRKELYLYEENSEKRNNENTKKKNSINNDDIGKTLIIKSNLIKNLYLTDKKKQKIINWNIFDIYGKEPKPKRLSRYIRSDLNDDLFLFNQILEEEDGDSKNKITRINSSKMKLNQNVLSNIKESSNEKYNSDLSPRQNIQNDLFNKNKSTKKFLLSVNEIRIGLSKIGYIFKFEIPNIKNTKNYSILSSTNSPKKMSRIKNEPSENEKSDNSDVSFVNIPKHPSQKIIFNKTENNSGIDLGLDISFIPKISKESEFYVDIMAMSYRQKFNKDKKKVFRLSETILRDQAEDKILKLKQKKKNRTRGRRRGRRIFYIFLKFRRKRIT